jgi:hypothetical protein
LIGLLVDTPDDHESLANFWQTALKANNPFFGRQINFNNMHITVATGVHRIDRLSQAALPIHIGIGDANRYRCSASYALH